MRMTTVATILAGCVALTGCSASSETPGLGEATLADLQAAIDRGDNCADLIEIKNNMDPKSSDYEDAPEALRSVGCFSTASTRTD